MQPPIRDSRGGRAPSCPNGMERKPTGSRSRPRRPTGVGAGRGLDTSQRTDRRRGVRVRLAPEIRTAGAANTRTGRGRLHSVRPPALATRFVGTQRGARSPLRNAAPRSAWNSLAPSLMSRALQQFLVLMLRDLFPAFLDHAAHAIPPFYDQRCEGYTSLGPGPAPLGSSSEDPTPSLPSRRI